MFGPVGHAYVYLVYGLHSCLNVVCERDGEAGAVLIRAIAPVAGVARMRARRGRHLAPDELLAAGPARVCQALAVDRSLDGHDLTTGRDLWIAQPPPPPDQGATAEHGGTAEQAATVVHGPRIGVAYAGPRWARVPWRFGLCDHPSLSRPFKAPDR